MTFHHKTTTVQLISDRKNIYPQSIQQEQKNAKPEVHTGNCRSEEKEVEAVKMKLTKTKTEINGAGQ